MCCLFVILLFGVQLDQRDKAFAATGVSPNCPTTQDAKDSFADLGVEDKTNQLISVAAAEGYVPNYIMDNYTDLYGSETQRWLSAAFLSIAYTITWVGLMKYGVFAMIKAWALYTDFKRHIA